MWPNLTKCCAGHTVWNVVQTPVELAQVFADVARALLGEDDVEATLDKITKLAVETIAITPQSH